MVPEAGFQSQVESYKKLKKWYLMLPCLALGVIRYGSRVKWNNPENGVASFPTPRCSSYWKGSIRVAFDWGRQLIKLYKNYHQLRIFDMMYFVQWVTWKKYYLSRKPNLVSNLTKKGEHTENPTNQPTS